MSDVMAGLVLLLLATSFVVGVARHTYDMGRAAIMAEAGVRGLAVQCPGVTGWHWECEE